jgi:hypothetical protein
MRYTSLNFRRFAIGAVLAAFAVGPALASPISPLPPGGPQVASAVPVNPLPPFPAASEGLSA